MDRTAADRAFVRLLAGKDPRSTVRATAWSALTSSAPDAAIARFFASDYTFAVSRAAQTRVRNADFARRVLATHTAEYAPQVHAAAQRAVNGTDADRELFARSGYAAAKDRDRLIREEDGRQAAALVAADRAFVEALAVDDPGPQVRGAAAWATRPGATDTDVVEFFAFGWANGAALDLEVHRATLADREVAWRTTAARLVTEAQAAEQAALQAGAEAAAREAAVRAWAAAAGHTDGPRVAWADAEAVAAAQAANWRAVAAAALAASGPNWAAATGMAAAGEQDWAGEQLSAVEQSRYWADLYDEAVAGERRMSGF